MTGLIVLSDPATGVPVSVMDGTLVTGLRTGASAGVAARLLAREGRPVAAIVGCGVQGRTSLRALAAALPGLREVRCRDRSRVSRSTSSPSWRRCCRALNFAFAVRRPRRWPAPMSWSRRSPWPAAGAARRRAAGSRALAVALDYDAAWTAAGDGRVRAPGHRRPHADPGDQGRRRPPGATLPGVDADLGRVVAGLEPGRLRRRLQRVFCLNLGIATHDLLTARLVYDRAAGGRRRHAAAALAERVPASRRPRGYAAACERGALAARSLSHRGSAGDGRRSARPGRSSSCRRTAPG